MDDCYFSIYFGPCYPGMQLSICMPLFRFSLYVNAWLEFPRSVPFRCQFMLYPFRSRYCFRQPWKSRWNDHRSWLLSSHPWLKKFF